MKLTAFYTYSVLTCSYWVGLTSYCTKPSQHTWKISKVKTLPLHSPEVAFSSTVLVNWSNQKCGTDWQFLYGYVHPVCPHCPSNSMCDVFLERLLLRCGACQNINNLSSLSVHCECLWKRVKLSFAVLITWTTAMKERDLWSIFIGSFGKIVMVLKVMSRFKLAYVFRIELLYKQIISVVLVSVLLVFIMKIWNCLVSNVRKNRFLCKCREWEHKNYVLYPRPNDNFICWSRNSYHLSDKGEHKIKLCSTHKSCFLWPQMVLCIRKVFCCFVRLNTFWLWEGKVFSHSSPLLSLCSEF